MKEILSVTLWSFFLMWWRQKYTGRISQARRGTEVGDNPLRELEEMWNVDPIFPDD